MSATGWYGLLAKGAKGVFRVFGEQRLLLKLKDFLLHGGRQSRAEMVASAAKATHELAEVELLKMKRLAALVEVLKAAGFPTERIHALVEDQLGAESLINDFVRLIDHIDRGNVRVVFIPESQSQLDAKALLPGHLSQPRNE